MRTKIKKSLFINLLLVVCLSSLVAISGCGGKGGGGGGTLQTFTTITISPTSATVVSGATQTFTVKGYDQNGKEMSFTPVFTVTPSELGTITLSGQNGIFTAKKKGTGTIKVTGGNNKTATANIEVITGPLKFTCYLTNTSYLIQRRYTTIYSIWS